MTSLTSSSTASLADQPEIVDVWSRTAPKYRRRAALLLGVTLSLFAGLCCFAYWLRTGLYGPWMDPASYRDLMWKSFNPVGGNQVTLVDFLLFPISVEQVPVHWIIMGLLLASLASVPILVAILYRFPASVACAFMVGALAAMPWLGLTVLLGCILASMKRFRLSFRFASAVLGLIPVAIYFVSAARQPESVFSVTPYRAKIAAPWVLAVLGSCVICAVALFLAKLINYRPGGIAPILAILFGVPVALFHTQVGRDELEYRILEDRVGPGSRHVFVSRALGEEVRRRATDAWAAEQDVSLSAFRDRMLREARSEAYEEQANDRLEVVARCDRFLERFGDPPSRYVPNVLFLQGRALDMRIDRALLDGDECLLQFHSDVPRSAARPVWERLATRFPDSDLAAFALYQLALLDGAAGRLDDAVRRLDLLVARFSRPALATQPAAGAVPTGLFGKAAPSSSLGFDPAVVVRQAVRLRELILAHRDDPLYGDVPLRAFLSLNRRHPLYPLNIVRLMLDHPGARIEPVCAVRLARQETSPRALVERLQRLAAEYAAAPARAEILFALGRAREDLGRLAEARQTFETLLEDHPDSSFAADARERLIMLTMLEISRPAGGGRP